MSKEKEEKAPNPRAPFTGDLPELLENCEWDFVTINGYDYVIQVPSNLDGIVSLCKDRADEKGAQLFRRGQNIEVPAKLEARQRLAEFSQHSPEYLEVARKIQEEILNFDLSAIPERKPRGPKIVKLQRPKNQDAAQAAAWDDLAKQLAGQGVKVVIE